MTTLVGINAQRFCQEGVFLSQNYPNPFNSSSSIRYSIPATSHVQLKVYETTGREVTVLVNKEQWPGVYEVIFKPDKVPGGILFYKLQAGGLTMTRKMVYIKQ